MTSNRLDIALAALFLAVVAPFVQTLTAQGAPRYALSSALAEHQTFELDRYEDIIGVDRVEVDGHIYSDKAPGQPIMGAPVALLASALGAEPATADRIEGNLGFWAQTMAFCTLPGAILLVLMRRHADRSEDPRRAAVAALGLSFGTMLISFASNLYGHILAATLLFAAWHLVSSSRSRTSMLAAGGLTALATSVEYPSVLVGFIIGIWLLVHTDLRRSSWYALPNIAALGLLLLHNRFVYGTAATGYTAKEEAGGQLNFIHLPNPSNIAQILFGARGFVFTPIVLLGIAALVAGLWQRRSGYAVPAAAFGALFLLQAGWANPWGGGGPGPRYISPALPFLVVPIANGLRWLSSRGRWILVAIGIFSMMLVLSTYELVPGDGRLISTHLTALTGEAGPNPTLFTMAIGPIGWIIHAGLVIICAAGVHRAWPSASAAIARRRELGPLVSPQEVDLDQRDGNPTQTRLDR